VQSQAGSAYRPIDLAVRARVCLAKAFNLFGKEAMMTKTAQVRPPAQRSLSVYLTAGPAAAAEARRCVREAIEAWGVSVDPYVAALLTSELVTNAVRYAGGAVKLFVTCACDHLRVYVHDASPEWPALLDTPVEAEDGRGLKLVASLSTDWGCYRTSAGKAVHFALAIGRDER
jgi:anti-sigma regulatory factor (Ser/Thr protein kinase)